MGSRAIDRYAVCQFARWWLREPDHEAHVLGKGWTREADLEACGRTCLGEIDFTLRKKLAKLEGLREESETSRKPVTKSAKFRG